MAWPKGVSRKKADDDEAFAGLALPAGEVAPDGVTPLSNLTTYERSTLEREAIEKCEAAKVEMRRREHARNTESDLRVAQNAFADKVRAVILDHFRDDPMAEDVANLMMRDIAPILAAGKEGRRRERIRYLQPAKAA